MDTALLSVILCTHDPRPDYLARALEALRRQTLPPERWDLLLIDNASAEPLAGRTDLSWHPRSCVLREDELGLTPARLRGIRESSAELLVFVDDDNVLAGDYLEQALRIGERYPVLGAWGGVIEGDFEQPPPPWAGPYLGMLAIRSATQDRWGNHPLDWSAVPFGAGLCVRKRVAVEWAGRLEHDRLRRSMGRAGRTLGAAEDTDLALTAYDCGLGTGVFVQLRVRHLIPRSRLTLEYFERLAEGMGRAHVFLESFRNPELNPPQRRLMERLRQLRRWWRLSPEQRRIERARAEGEASAFRELGVARPEGAGLRVGISSLARQRSTHP